MSYNYLLAFVNHCYEDMAYIPSEAEIEDEIGWCLSLDDYDRFEKYVPLFISVNDMTGVDIHYKGVKSCKRIIETLPLASC